MQCFLAYLQNCTITTTIRIFHLQQIPYLLVDTPFSSLHLAPLAPTHLFSMSLPILDLLYNVQSLLTGFSQQSYQCSSMLQHISGISISFLLMTKQYSITQLYHILSTHQLGIQAFPSLDYEHPLIRSYVVISFPFSLVYTTQVYITRSGYNFIFIF